MGVTNVLTSDIKSTRYIIENYLANESITLLKQIRFDVGKFDEEKFYVLTRLAEAYERAKENKHTIREQAILHALTNIPRL